MPIVLGGSDPCLPAQCDPPRLLLGHGAGCFSALALKGWLVSPTACPCCVCAGAVDTSRRGSQLSRHGQCTALAAMRSCGPSTLFVRVVRNHGCTPAESGIFSRVSAYRRVSCYLWNSLRALGPRWLLPSAIGFFATRWLGAALSGFGITQRHLRFVTWPLVVHPFIVKRPPKLTRMDALHLALARPPARQPVAAISARVPARSSATGRYDREASPRRRDLLQTVPHAA